MIFSGIIFIFLGSITLIVGINTCVGMSLVDGLMPSFVGALFVTIGCRLIGTRIVQHKNHARIIRYGEKHLGKIIDYADDTSIYVNGIPLAFVVIEYAPKGEVMTGLFKTNSTNPSKWPIGSAVYIYEYKGQYAWDHKILSKPYSN